MHRSEVPDCFYAGIDHSVRHLLRSIRGYGDDAYLDIESLDDFSEFGHIVHGLTIDFGVDYSFVFSVSGASSAEMFFVWGWGSSFTTGIKRLANLFLPRLRT